MRKAQQEVRVWQPLEWQSRALLRTEREILAGGSRGPGKTELQIVWMMLLAIARSYICLNCSQKTRDSEVWGDPRPKCIHCGEPFPLTKIPSFTAATAGERSVRDWEWTHPYYQGIILRSRLNALNDTIQRCEVMYRAFGGKKKGRPVQFDFPSGAIIKTGHLRDESSFSNYIGHEYQRMGLEELTLIQEESLYEKLLGSLRSTHPDLVPQVMSTTNPGNAGHGWVKARWVDVKDVDGRKIPPNTPFYAWKRAIRKGAKEEWGYYLSEPKEAVDERGFSKGSWRIFIPSTIDDNPHLAEVDPNYVAYLDSLPEQQKKAWRYGSWDAAVGQYFSEFRRMRMSGEPEWASHVVPAAAVNLQPWFHRWIAMDWGREHPSAVGWFVQHDDGRVYQYRELYRKDLSGAEIGFDIAKMSARDLEEMPEPYMVMFLSPDAFGDRTATKTIAQQIAEGIDNALGVGTAVLVGPNEPMPSMRGTSKAKVVVRMATNRRVDGWMFVHEMLRWRPLPIENIASEVLPKFRIFDCCEQTIESISSVIHDEKKQEDVAKGPGDDGADMVRYGLMAHSERENLPPLQAWLGQRLVEFTERHGGNPDMTSLYQFAEFQERKYHEMHGIKAQPVTFARGCSRLAQRQADKVLWPN